MKIGLGYDIHKLTLGTNLIIGGVKIPYEKGFLAHSDGDVLVHALIDAILGALGEKDIGTQFPDNDPKYKDADSIELLKFIFKKFDFEIENIDSNIICEEPKLAPYIDAMKKNIAQALNILPEQISVKAKTNEGLGAVGRGEAVRANAVVLLK